jgi:hypothetical protein
MFRRKLGDKFGDLDPAHVNIVVVSDTAGLKWNMCVTAGGDVFVRGDEKELRNELIFGLRNAVERLAGLP